MEAERWTQIEDLLQSALELAPDSRDEFLRVSCREDPTLAEEVRSLMTSFRRAGGFLETPAVEIAARAIATESAPSFGASRAGQIVSQYRLLSMIGSGGMGSVWVAERCDGRFDRKVAIKFIHFTLLDTVGTDQFKREGAILGKLAHPQIAELIDAGLTKGGEPYLALEYVEGQSIDGYCDQNKLNIEARIRLFLDVLRGVAHAHSNLIVHRDIKPTNVFVRRDGVVKLLDFGIARVLSQDAGMTSAAWVTRTGGTALTPMFSAPEQLTQSQITTATDIYSLGVLLYLLLTGRHPAGAGPHSIAQLIRAVVESESPRASTMITEGSEEAAVLRGTTPEQLRRQLRGDLERILAKSLRKDPAERYPTALAFAEDLRRYLEHRPVLARPDSPGYRMAKFVRRHRVGVALATTALIGATCTVAWIATQNRRVRAERDFAYSQLANLYQHDDFLEFLLSNAAPSGQPFTVNKLLDRATQIVERQKSSPAQVALLDWIGSDYAGQDEHAKAREILEKAYKLSRQAIDPAIRASASCSLGAELSRDEDLTRGEALIEEGLRTLPNDPRYAVGRVNCLRFGGEISREKGEGNEAVHRMELAKSILRASPFDSNQEEMTVSLDLAAVYSEAGRDYEALAEFQRAATLMSSLGRDETATAVVLYNDWALELDQVGQPLEAERNYRKVIDISRDSSSEDSVSAMVLNNYARVQRELHHLSQAADYAERAYSKAKKTGDELVISQSLLERVRIYREQHDLPRAEAMLDEVEPRLHKQLPPGHYAFSVVSTERGMIAFEKRDLNTALRLIDQSIAMVRATVKSGGSGVYTLPGLYIDRSEIDLALGHAGQAEEDAQQALAALELHGPPSGVSSKLGHAFLAQTRALTSEDKKAQAQAIAVKAFDQLQGSLGPDHPDTRAAQHFME